MHSKRLIILSMIGLVILFSTQMTQAEKLRGTNLLGATLDVYNWHDSGLEDVLNRSYGTTVFWNYSLDTHWDLALSYSGVWDSVNDPSLGKVEANGQSGELGLAYLFLPDSPINPYLGGSVGIARTGVEWGPYKESINDILFGAALGAEWDVCKTAYIDASVFYEYVDTGATDNNGIYGLNVSAGITLIENLILTAGASYTFEDVDTLIGADAIIREGALVQAGLIIQL